MGAELPWSGCAERAVEVVRASVPAGGRVAVSPFVDMGGRLNYFGEALTAEVKEALVRGATPYVLLEPTAISSADAWMGGSVIDGEKTVSVAATLSVKGSPVDAVHCEWNKDDAFAEALRGELLRRRGLLEEDRGRLDLRISALDALLAKGVWKEGPSFQVAASSPAVAAGVGAVRQPAWSPWPRPGRTTTVWVGAGDEMRWDALAISVRVRRPRWDMGITSGRYDVGAGAVDDIPTATPGLFYGSTDIRRVFITFFNIDARWRFPVESLLSVPVHAEGAIGGGVSLDHLNERLQMHGQTPAGVGYNGLKDAGQAAATVVKPFLTASIERAFGRLLSLEFGVDYIPFAKPVGDARLVWGGWSLRGGVNLRVF